MAIVLCPLNTSDNVKTTCQKDVDMSVQIWANIFSPFIERCLRHSLESGLLVNSVDLPSGFLGFIPGCYYMIFRQII